MGRFYDNVKMHKKQYSYIAIALIIIFVVVSEYKSIRCFEKYDLHVTVNDIIQPGYKPQKKEFYPKIISAADEISKSWVVLSGSTNSLSSKNNMHIFFNMDSGEVTSVRPSPTEVYSVEVQVADQWVSILDTYNTTEVFTGEIRVRKDNKVLHTVKITSDNSLAIELSAMKFRMINEGVCGIMTPQQIFCLNIETGNFWALPNSFLEYSEIEASPDGSIVLAGRYTSDKNFIGLDTTTMKEFTIDRVYSKGVPSMSIDFNHILYQLYSNHYIRVEVASLFGKGKKTVINTTQTISTPVWLQNDEIGLTLMRPRSIIELAPFTGVKNTTIVKVNAITGKKTKRRIPFWLPKTDGVFFSTDGKYAFYISNTTLVRVRLRN